MKSMIKQKALEGHEEETGHVWQTAEKYKNKKWRHLNSITSLKLFNQQTQDVRSSLSVNGSAFHWYDSVSLHEHKCHKVSDGRALLQPSTASTHLSFLLFTCAGAYRKVNFDWQIQTSKIDKIWWGWWWFQVCSGPEINAIRQGKWIVGNSFHVNQETMLEFIYRCDSYSVIIPRCSNLSAVGHRGSRRLKWTRWSQSEGRTSTAHYDYAPFLPKKNIKNKKQQTVNKCFNSYLFLDTHIALNYCAVLLQFPSALWSNLASFHSCIAV